MGFNVLNISKLDMADFHYNHILNQYDHTQVKLIATDTDSFIYHIQTEDYYKDMEKHKHLYDLSNYDPDELNGWLFDKENEKVLGKMKDETPNDIICETVALCSKMYCNRLLSGKLKSTAKGIKTYVKDKMLMDDYLSVVKDNTKKRQMVTQNCLRSNNHEIGKFSITKKGLRSFDDKTYLHDDGIHNWKWGHWRIPK